MVSRLRSAGLDELAGKIEACHTEPVYLICKGCSTVRKVWNHCDNHLCPKCQPRLARERYDQVRFWAGQVAQPKHVVLTVRNTDTIDRDQIRGLVRCFARLRRLKFARNWKGGMWAVEITNEAKGWHIHLHVLVDAKWIDSTQLAQSWARIVRQDFAIVKVKDARAADYVKECAKYCVKGTDLAAWHPGQLKAFVDAIEGCRTFGTFGTLYKRRKKLTEFLDAMMNERRACECGCSDWRALTENEYDASMCTWTPPPKKKPEVPAPSPQLNLL